MKILLIGSGGRECALGLAITRSKLTTKLYSIPGNPYLENLGECLYEHPTDNASIVEFCKTNEIGLVVIGPEAFLEAGLADDLQTAGILAFGPSKLAAQIESSKQFMKDFCTKYNIPTAKYQNFTQTHSRTQILDFVSEIGYPAVLKTDGLAAGKGVVICNNQAEFEQELDEYFSGKFGAASKRIVVEEFMTGREVSFFAISDGTTALPFTHAGDYKRAYDGDKGANTGGMGAYSPSPFFIKTMQDFTIQNIINPLVEGMKAEGHPYIGVIFAGLILTPTGVRLIEFNARFGDPETQSMIMRLESDFVEIALKATQKQLKGFEIKFSTNLALNVVMASKGYPDEYTKGVQINGIEELNGVEVFHAGTKKQDGKIFTNGGRVLNITSTSSTYAEVRDKIYSQIHKIKCDNLFYRTDIGLIPPVLQN
jgi:phosphoribosylamine--glycine ligase